MAKTSIFLKLALTNEVCAHIYWAANDSEKASAGDVIICVELHCHHGVRGVEGSRDVGVSGGGVGGYATVFSTKRFMRNLNTPW